MIRRFRRFFFAIALLSTSSLSLAQTLPGQWSFSSDGKMILQGKNAPVGYYDSSIIRTIYLDFPNANFWSQLQANAMSQTEIPAVMTVDGITYDTVGVRFRGNTSQQGAGQKRSFKISVDYKNPNQDLMGYNTLKLNNGNQDRSHLREVFYLHQIRKHVPAAKANYVRLFLNNSDWGIYPNIQQMNKDFLGEWFLSNDGANWRAERPSGMPGPWGDGTAALNYLGPDTATYKTYYTLKSSDILMPWDNLVNVCSALNNSGSNIQNTLPSTLDVDRALWFLASEIAWTDDDSYVMKGKMDYYAYYEPETGRFAPMEYDGNSTMVLADTASWSPFYNASNANYPLLNKLLAVPEWRQRYLAHMRTIIEEEMDTASCFAMLNNYKAQIEALVQADPKKIYSYNQFLNEQNVLKRFITARRRNLLANAEVAELAPVIFSADYMNQSNQLWTTPQAGEAVKVTTSVSSVNGISNVYLYYATGLVGNFTRVEMFDDGAHDDNGPGDGIYGASIPGQNTGTWVRWYIEAVANNTAKSVSYLPAGAEHDVFYYLVGITFSSSPVVINEVMPANTSYMADGNGEYDDWIELYNNSSSPVDISGYYLTDNITNLTKWQIPSGTILPANGYQTFWADEDQSQGWNHLNFKLSAQSEFIWLINNNLQVIDSVAWSLVPNDSAYARIPNGTGSFVIKNPTYGYNNQSSSAIETATAKASFRVYPNPASGTVWFETTAGHRDRVVEVINATGQVVFTRHAPAGILSIHTSGWPDGIYLVRYGDEVQKLMLLNH